MKKWLIKSSVVASALIYTVAWCVCLRFLPVPHFGVFHVVSSLLLPLVWVKLMRSQRKWEVPFYLASTLLIPVLGLWMSLAFLIAMSFHTGENATFSFPEADRSEEALLEYSDEDGISEKMLQQEFQVQSYSDVLKTGSVMLKRALINRLIRTPSLESVRLLKVALEDDIYEVRTFASTALSTIECNYVKRIKDVHEKLRDDHTPENKLLYIESILDYVHSELMGTKLNDYNLNLVTELFSQLNEAELTHASKDKFMELRAIYFQMIPNHTLDAELLQNLLGRPGASTKTLLSLAESLFQQGRFELLKNLCDNLRLRMTEKTPESVLLWLGATETSVGVSHE